MSDASAAFGSHQDYLARCGGMLGRPRYRRPDHFFLWLAVAFLAFWAGFLLVDWMGGR